MALVETRCRRRRNPNTEDEKRDAEQEQVDREEEEEEDEEPFRFIVITFADNSWVHMIVNFAAHLEKVGVANYVLVSLEV